MTHIEKANELFAKKFHCSQAVFAAFAEELGVTEEQALKIGACFGSGMRKGEVCGACTGALMALGLKYGQSSEEDMSSRLKTNEVTDRFMSEFKKENGSYMCKELLGCDLATEEGIVIALEKNLFTEFCPRMVRSATKIAEDILCTKNESKVIFLDIDGVLNSNFWNDSHQKEISNGTLVDEEKIKILAPLIKKTNAKIILHSGWRIWFDKELKPIRTEAERLVDLLAKEGLVIDGLAPDLTTEEIRETKKFSLVKADEILSWLKLHDDVTGWVVIDDLDLNNAIIEQHQVKPDNTVGLTIEDIEKAEKILLGEN